MTHLQHCGKYRCNFVEVNGERIGVDDELKVIRFMREIKSYDVIEIEAWLRDGEVPKRPCCRSS